MLDYIKQRLCETSTLRGLVFLIGGIAGLKLSDGDVMTVVSFAQLVAGLIGAALPDRWGAK